MQESPLTIILTIKGRTPFTLRWMRYMNDMKCAHRILIADGGNDKEIENRLKEYKNYPDLSYEYIRYPYDADFDCYYDKLMDVVSRITTPYVLFADNDDFYLLDKIPSYIKFLDANSDYVSCGGSHGALEILSDAGETVNAYKGIGYFIREYCGILRTIASSSPVERVCYFFRHTDTDDLWMNWYFIHRSSAIIKAYETLKVLRLREIVGFEIYVLIYLLFSGKSKGNDELFYIRQKGTSQLTASINAELNLVERFVKNNVFYELLSALEHLPVVLNESEKDAVCRSLSLWFGLHAANLYVSAGKYKNLKSIYRRIVSGNYYFAGLFRVFSMHASNIIRKNKFRYVRMPLLEKYIIEGKA
ncbi:MAG: TIGR00180 family glycosyltransferase [Chlorobiaceae bacterium]